ncbi:TylF/MycF/NovP-related O-methyltransferase [Roseibium sp. RKSG952]|uniref:TylF/MycF/NovP-related O-methyltransferase n=1 Tax=Roseibium sp. RKSG952 TaxID=2529384 RepID=UPI0012BBA84E|nr:TylF/MycF/NovP-related O-methyltransferase [Roseibium sp. RKSG952]MTH99979.1 macrocin O-methyltransferase [Roseibium sp. RKSG952]
MTLPPRKIVYSETHDADLVDYPIRDIDENEQFMELFLKSRDFTMTGKDAMFALYNACKYVHSAGIAGDFVECGTWMGGSAILAGLTFEALGKPRDLWLYDTYEGMTAPTEADVDVNGDSASALMETFGDETGWCYASLDQVSQNFGAAGLSTQNARFVKGDVMETLKDQLPEQISVLRLDTDWYESTRFELDVLYPRLAPGGVLIIDDYGHWSGSRKATDEYFSTIRAPMLNRVNDQVRLCIKI